jgi:hypothetical protein
LIVPLGDIVYEPPTIDVTVAVPSQPGEHVGGVVAVTLILGAFGALSNTVVVPEQLLAVAVIV